MTQPVPGFRARLEALAPVRRTAFMATLTERLLPNAGFYAEANGTASALETTRELRKLLDLVWEQLRVRDTKIDFSLQAEKVTAFEPDEHDDSFGARRALEAVMALTACIDVLISEEPEAALKVSRLSADGVRALIDLQAGEGIEQEALEAMIREHPLMVDERDFQDAVLESVEAPRLERDDWRALKRLGRNEDVSNLGLSLQE
ncbi:YjaG family protein [Cobetia marina]|uniref:YjaG family protein n=1 Tax=Cobetia marina TaxID=28258 RepID=UPI003A9580B4